MINTRLIAGTIHGDIYGDGSMELAITDHYMGQKVEGIFDKGASSLQLNTINGNMYLRLRCKATG